MIYFNNEQWALMQGDCLDSLRRLSDQSIQCCVTSPPYFGLRDYGVDGQIGLEPTPDGYVAALVRVFREVRRVLRNDGTLWLNLGDSYAGSWGNYGGAKRGKGTQREITTGSKVKGQTERNGLYCPPTARVPGLKPKDLIGIPWRVAFALQQDGWYLRQDIIWHKPNPMPESVKDRCTKAHEYIFLLSKGPKYYFDSEAIKEPMVCGARGSEFHTGKTGEHQQGRASKKPRRYTKPYTGEATKDYESSGAQNASETKRRIVEKILSGEISGRNKRSVWTVTTKPFKGAHFATFPPDLIEPCVLAGSRVGDMVLDPFNGAGTTGLVALKHGRKYLGLELNPEYCEITVGRLSK